MTIINRQQGLSLIELMVALVSGSIIVTAMLSVYLAQTQIYRTGVSQSTIQNAENALNAIITPIVRGAGFSGCANVVQVLSNLNSSGSLPLGGLATTPAMVYGYGAQTAITQDNSANDNKATDWVPNLDTTLLNMVEAGSDVVVFLGAQPFSAPIGVTAFTAGSNNITLQNVTGLVTNQLVTISDCAKASVFQITGLSANTISHAAGSGVFANANNALAVNYAIGAQVIPLQQTALFIGQGPGGQSALMQATLNGTTSNTWTVRPLVPGVEIMQVQYGIGTNALVTQYVTASNVTNWAAVYAVKFGFIVEGQLASGSPTKTNPVQYSLFGNTLTVPADNRLRHAFEMTVYLRNALL